LRLLPEGGRGLMPGCGPVAPLGGGLRRQTVENTTFRACDGLVADEIVEASSKTCRDDLQRAKRGTNETCFDLTDEALGKFVAGKLRLAHAQRVASGADALAQSHRLLNSFWQTRHRRSPCLDRTDSAPSRSSCLDCGRILAAVGADNVGRER